MKLKSKLFSIAILTTSFFSVSVFADSETLQKSNPRDYETIIMDASDWADFHGKTHQEYLNHVEELWYEELAFAVNEIVSASTNYPLANLLSNEKEMLKNPTYGDVWKQCEYAKDRLSCMDEKFEELAEKFAKDIIEKRITGRISVNEIIKNPVDSCQEVSKGKPCLGCHCASTFENENKYAGYYLCSDIHHKVAVMNDTIVNLLISDGFLIEGVPYEIDMYGVGPDLHSIIKNEGWTIEDVMKIPTDEVKKQNKMFGAENKNKLTGGCLEENTPVTRLSHDSSFFLNPFSSWKGVTKAELGDISKNDLKARPTPIKDIETGDLVLSSTIASLLSEDEEYKEACWAEVGEVYESTLGEWGYEGFQEITYESDKNYKILATQKHSFHGHTGDGNMTWMQAGNPMMSRMSLTGIFPIRLKVVNLLYKTSGYSSTTPIYNLLIPETFSFYVGEKPVLGHNLTEKM